MACIKLVRALKCDVEIVCNVTPYYGCECACLPIMCVRHSTARTVVHEVHVRAGDIVSIFSIQHPIVSFAFLGGLVLHRHNQRRFDLKHLPLGDNLQHIYSYQIVLRLNRFLIRVLRVTYMLYTCVSVLG